jgi:tRNA 5-methylaminomethyl-2-thiouridine biosynthesis bifunctional protein
VQALDSTTATALAGVPLGAPAWFYPGGGWLAPGDLVRHWLAQPGVTLRTGAAVARIEATALDGRPVDTDAPGATASWRAFDTAGRLIAEAPVMVLAGAAATPALLATLGAADPLRRAPWALGQNRGQIDGWRGRASPLALPVAGNGYALPLPDGLLFGASITPTAAGVPPAPPSTAETAFNRDRLLRLTGLVDPCASAPCPSGAPVADRSTQAGPVAPLDLREAGAGLAPLRRTALRLQTADRLPLAGPMPSPLGERLSRADPLRRLPRWPGLYALTALGSRGITWAPLLGALVAAQVAGHPWPLERDLADALDPARRPRRGPTAPPVGP